MKLCYILIFTIFTNIYSALPSVCTDNGNPVAEGACTDALCGEGKKTYNNKCYTAAQVANCQTVNPNYDACYQCKTGYVFNENNLCVAEKGNCAEHYPAGDRNAGKCKKCNTGYKTDNGGCTSCGNQISSDGVYCNEPNCAVQDSSNGHCTRCNDGYYVNNQNGCTQCPSETTSKGYSSAAACAATLIDNCMAYNSGACTTCVAGKYLLTTTSGGSATTSCVDCTENGQNPGDDNVCYTGDSDSNGSGTDGCGYYSDPTTCIKCANDYLGFVSGSCVPCYYPQVSHNGLYCYTPSHKENCGNFNTATDTCIECVDGYHLNNDNVCEKTCPDCIRDDTNNPKTSGEASNSSAMKLNIIFMAIMLMIVA